jgi:hypothetical protein
LGQDVKITKLRVEFHPRRDFQSEFYFVHAPILSKMTVEYFTIKCTYWILSTPGDVLHIAKYIK